jgi:hypothetical protein
MRLHKKVLSRRSYAQLFDAPRNESPMKYELGPSVRAYVAYKCACQDSSAEADLARERALKEAVNRELREILLFGS